MNDVSALPTANAPIDDRTSIYRLVPVEQCVFRDGEWIFQSAAFDNSSIEGYENEMSVVVGDTLAALDREPDDLPQHSHADEPERWGVAVLEAGCIRNVNEQTIQRSPTDQEPAHGDVLGGKNSKRRRRLKACAAWVVPPAAPAPTS